MKVIKFIEENKSKMYFASLFCVSKFQIHWIRVIKENIKYIYRIKSLSRKNNKMANWSRYRELDDSILNWLNTIRNLTSRCKPFSLSRAHIQAQASNEAMAREIWDFKESGWVATGDSVARSGLVFFFLERLEMLTSQKRNLSLRYFSFKF